MTGVGRWSVAERLITTARSTTSRISLDVDFYLGNTSLLRLYGATGALRKELPIAPGQQEISLGIMDLPKGVYFVEILTDFGRLTRSIVKY